MNRKKRYPVNEEAVIEALSEERLSSYHFFAFPKDKQSLILSYDCMQLLSSYLFLPLEYLEVTLRNRIYRELTRHYHWRGKKYKSIGKAEEWLDWMPTEPITKKKVLRAKGELKQRGLGNKPEEIISELSFGVWVSILKEHQSQNSQYHFWLYTQKRLFPNANGTSQMKVYSELKEIRDIRNRLFHYEPIWNTHGTKNCCTAILEILHKYKKVMKVIRWLSFDVFNLLKSRRHERELAKDALSYYRMFKVNRKLACFVDSESN